jgi:hydrogenase small subunit
MAGNPTGAMGVADYLGRDWKSKAGLPIVNVPGCPIQPDNMSETLVYLLYQLSGQAPMISLDDALRPAWLFGRTVHEGRGRAGYYEQGRFAKDGRSATGDTDEKDGKDTKDHDSPTCLVKIGCWGPVVKCDVPKRGWANGLGGCPNVGGICIACTMPGFPSRFMPFADEPPGAHSSSAVTTVHGAVIRALRNITVKAVDREPKWRRKGHGLLTGHKPPGN